MLLTKRVLLAAVATLGVSACAPERRLMPVMTGPDGTSWLAVHCRDHIHCLAQASFFCPEGYRIGEREGHVEGSVSSGVFRGTVSGETHLEESMLVQCKSCRMDRAVLVDEEGQMTRDPQWHAVASICESAAKP
jgi:hypothetical protein